MFAFLEPTNDIYEGQFGTFTINKQDRLGVAIYRGGLMVAAIALTLGSVLGLRLLPGNWPPQLTSVLYWIFCAGLGVSLATIHIYLVPLHRALQFFWLVGCLGSAWVAIQSPMPLIEALYQRPFNLMLGGWVFVALTGIYFKEAVCFNRTETKFLFLVVPILLGGHWLDVLSPEFEQVLLLAWSLLMLVFAIRKWIQPIPPDLGDKSVFDYLHQQRKQAKQFPSA